MPINPTTGLTYSEDISESSSSYTYKTAAVTAVSGNGTTITYTAVNTFSAGDVIDVTGSDISGYNLTYKTAEVTAISGNGTTVTYTAVNTFSVGDKINVTGSNVTGYNLTNATIASASGTQFTVTNSATGTNTSSNVFTATANATVATASATQFTVTNSTTGTNTSTSVVAFTASSVTPNIDAVVDLSYTAGETSFQPTDVAYDLSIDNIPFVLKIDNQNPYRRETAQYKKDQFDNSAEPGEQALTGWWVRSQTSWHNGAGIEFYEPGSDYQHVSHRFYDSRGIDVWTVGELRLHKDVFEAYTGIQGINAATGNDGTNDVLVSGDANGVLKKIILSGNSAASVSNYTAGASTFPDDHSGANHPFYSVATDGSTYYAVCDSAVHRGTIATATSDDIYFRYTSGTSTNAFVKYTGGFTFFAYNNNLATIKTGQTPTSATHTTGTVDGFTSSFLGGTAGNYKTHLNTSWIWKDVTASPGGVYAAGNGGNRGEIWKVLFDTTGTTLDLDMPGATMALHLPDGELVNSIHYYLGYLAVGTNKGIRICQLNTNGDIVMAPLLIETGYTVNAFTERGSYLYAATQASSGTNLNAILIRIDLSQQFDDGTFAYAYDLEYDSTPDDSNCTEVYNLNDRLVMVVQEGVGSTKGELQVEHTTNYRSSGWLQTGKIRYSTVEPKFFKYLQTRGLIAVGDSIAVQTIDYAGNEYDIITLDGVSIGENVGLNQPIGGQEFIAIKFTLNNGSPITDYPVLQSYQLKAVPGVPRQRMYQYPLSCYDIEMDKYNSQFGYTGRAYEVVEKLEQLESLGDFVSIKDFRNDESFQGVIEEVRFTNESSPDKDSNGFGGLLLVTVRKL